MLLVELPSKALRQTIDPALRFAAAKSRPASITAELWQ